jgi:glycerol-1-phosphate dehydrogenase [NAD(P)+]
MPHGRIREALRGATDTRHVLIGAGSLASVADLYGQSFGDQPAVVVADAVTFDVAGKEVHRRLEAAVAREPAAPHVFPGRPTLYADYENVSSLIGSLREHDATPVAVGSGTLNDIVKRAAHECERPYLSVATAASMDGYTAFGAAITKAGYKQTMTCPAPRAVLADLDVLTRAPPTMTSSGYADLLAKVSAGADWIVADALEVEAIDHDVWSLVQGPLRAATGRPAELRAGEPAAMEAVIEGLILSGLAMQAHSSSRPASGAEHQFSHLWEMEGLGQSPADGGPPLSHGFKVGLGTVSIAALYERLLERDLGGLDVEAAVSARPSWEVVERAVRAAHTTPGLDDAAVAETRAKYVDADALRDRLMLLRERWPELRESLREQLMPADQLRRLLRAAGCPTTPAEIGLSPRALHDTYARARMIRRRFTVLDLAIEAGILGACVDELFAPGGFWGRGLEAR